MNLGLARIPYMEIWVKESRNYLLDAGGGAAAAVQDNNIRQ